jgi:hypothetical protein
MKKFLAFVLFAVATVAQAWEQRAPLPVQACAVHSPYGWAQASRPATPI